MYLYDVIGIFTDGISPIFYAFRLYLRFGRILVDFRIQVVFNGNGRLTRYEYSNSLYFLMFNWLLQDRVINVCFSLNDFAADFCGSFRDLFFIQDVSFGHISRVKSRVYATLVLYLCIDPLTACVLIRKCRSIVNASDPSGSGYRCNGGSGG